MTRALKYGNDFERIREREEMFRIQHLDGKNTNPGVLEIDPPARTFVELRQVFRFGKPTFMGQKAWMNSMKRASTG